MWKKKDFVKITLNILDLKLLWKIITSDKSKRCAFINNKYIKQYKKCEDYEGKNKNMWINQTLWWKD